MSCMVASSSHLSLLCVSKYFQKKNHVNHTYSMKKRVRWSYPSMSDLADPAVRFHKIVQLEIHQFASCLHGDSKRGNLFLPRAASQRSRQGGVTVVKGLNYKEKEAANEQGSSGSDDDELDSGEEEEEGKEEDMSSLSLIYENITTLNECKRRPDLNRDAYLNKCYSGRAILSIYAAFLVDWLEHFPGEQV
jgi:hypothetical protein